MIKVKIVVTIILIILIMIIIITIIKNKTGFELWFTDWLCLFMDYFKGCVCYIFTSWFFKSKGEHLRNEEQCFLFHFKSSSHSQENQILEF